ncbi:2'-5' RNA ligase [Proteiniborus sp. DW1]|uniref:RNA 2',3'-cyclic phosphodiesterase n=1 Tax=Proteiniborus sp. DW1 TaxID=1889883 RepID=UPI00092DFF0B|nr:RNA 2',3'-cyclic phosphodiesterase [Proteiniborus sp. DW1]SCG83108.1 2'-5' RNA ligase [Proteiniborus sp. DW1]
MRTFIAFEFDSLLKERLALIQDKLRGFSIKGRWTHIDNFHLTLKFLGETTVEQCNKIEEQLSNTLNHANAVNLILENIGFFSGDSDIRVLYLGLKGEIEALQNLNNMIEESMVKLGYTREKRRFNPHITLGRNVVLKDSFNSVKELLKDDCNFSFTLSKISFMESQFSNGKRIYTPIKTFSL